MNTSSLVMEYFLLKEKGITIEANKVAPTPIKSERESEGYTNKPVLIVAAKKVATIKKTIVVCIICLFIAFLIDLKGIRCFSFCKRSIFLLISRGIFSEFYGKCILNTKIYLNFLCIYRKIEIYLRQKK